MTDAKGSRKRRMPVNMRSLAGELGLSPMTISRVLNGSSMVRPETRRQVLAKVRKLGYDSVTRLRKTKNEKARTVAIHCGAEKLLDKSGFGFYPQLFYHCLHRLRGLGLRGKLVDLNAGRDRDAGILAGCGSLIALGQVRAELRAKLMAPGNGMKVLDVMGEIDGFATVTPDEVGGGELAARHIAAMGHCHCACFLDISERSFRQRYAGFLAGMAAFAGKSQVDLITFTEGADQQAGDALKKEALDRYLATCGEKRATAFFAPGGYSARILYLHLRQRGLSMPKDFSLVGYDDLDYITNLEQGITRIVFSVRELAVKTAETLAALLDQKVQPAYKMLVPVQLVDQGSCVQVLDGKGSGRHRP